MTHTITLSQLCKKKISMNLCRSVWSFNRSKPLEMIIIFLVILFCSYCFINTGTLQMRAVVCGRDVFFLDYGLVAAEGIV